MANILAVFEDDELRDQATMVVEKAVHHGPEPVGEPGVEVGQVERVSTESVRATKKE